MKNRSRCLLLLVLSILICSVNIALADEIGKNFSHRIPIYNLSTGTTVYETKLAVHPYVSYSVLHKDQKIDGKYYTVYYDAKNPTIPTDVFFQVEKSDIDVSVPMQFIKKRGIIK